MTKGTVLVVDDDPMISAVIEQALEDEGYRVLASVDGHALGVARALHPDVILLDIMMPLMDGVEVSRRLRSDPTTADIPIIAMSAYRTLLDTRPEMAADDRLPKPFDLGDLYTTVGRWAHH